MSLRDAENGDEMIRRIIGNYDIGAKLRHLRLRKKIALVDLGKHTGLSASMLSQLENGKLIPTLPTLARIATVFDVGLEFFFGEKRQKKSFSVIRSAGPNPLSRSARNHASDLLLRSFGIRRNGEEHRRVSCRLSLRSPGVQPGSISTRARSSCTCSAARSR